MHPNKRTLSCKLQGLAFSESAGFRTLGIRIFNTKSHKYNAAARDQDFRLISRCYMEYIKSDTHYSKLSTYVLIDCGWVNHRRVTYGDVLYYSDRILLNHLICYVMT